MACDMWRTGWRPPKNSSGLIRTYSAPSAKHGAQLLLRLQYWCPPRRPDHEHDEMLLKWNWKTEMNWTGLTCAWTGGWGRICRADLCRSIEWKARCRHVSCHFGRGLIAILWDQLPTKASRTALFGLFWLNRRVGMLSMPPSSSSSI